METVKKGVFDKHKVALELGYSEEDIENFDNLRKVLDFWNEEVGAGRVKAKDFPKIDKKLRHEYCIYCDKLLDLKVKAILARS